MDKGIRVERAVLGLGDRGVSITTWALQSAPKRATERPTAHNTWALSCGRYSGRLSEPRSALQHFEAWAALKKEHSAVTAERQYQLLQAFTAVRQRPDESLTDFLSRLQIAKDHILASMPVDAKASDLLDTLVAFFGLHHLEETKENEEMRRTLQRTTKITLNGVQDAFTTEQVARETAAAAAKESAHRVQANAAKEGAKTRIKKREGPTCSHCNNAHKTEDCWAKFPEKRPDWMKLKMEFQAAEKAKKQATTSHRRERAARMEEESELEESAKMASRSSSSAA
ncbi:hypothetical protein FRB96_009684, partial [Tulasnella sp. 330]